MYEVMLPPWAWYEDGKVYSGSLSADPSVGSLQQTTLQYRARRMQDRLVAWCWFDLPWNVTTAIDETVIGRFEGSDLGVEVAENWIRSKWIADQGTAPLLGDGEERLCG